MRPVRFVALSDDAQSLVLTDEAGRMLALAVDERLVSAVASPHPRSAGAGSGANGSSRTGTAGSQGTGGSVPHLPVEVTTTLSPRDIQSRIRCGESPEDLARSAGVPVEKVLRYAGPVLAERAAMAEHGRRTRLRTSEDGATLASMADDRLRGHGVDVDTVSWDAHRQADGTWRVTASWPFGRSTAQASWDLDRARTISTPADEMAHYLSSPRLTAPSSGAGLFPHSTSRTGKPAQLVGDPRLDEPIHPSRATAGARSGVRRSEQSSAAQQGGPTRNGRADAEQPIGPGGKGSEPDARTQEMPKLSRPERTGRGQGRGTTMPPISGPATRAKALGAKANGTSRSGAAESATGSAGRAGAATGSTAGTASGDSRPARTPAAEGAPDARRPAASSTNRPSSARSTGKARPTAEPADNEATDGEIAPQTATRRSEDDTDTKELPVVPALAVLRPRKGGEPPQHMVRPRRELPSWDDVLFGRRK